MRVQQFYLGVSRVFMKDTWASGNKSSHKLRIAMTYCNNVISLVLYTAENSDSFDKSWKAPNILLWNVLQSALKTVLNSAVCRFCRACLIAFWETKNRKNNSFAFFKLKLFLCIHMFYNFRPFITKNILQKLTPNNFVRCSLTSENQKATQQQQFFVSWFKFINQCSNI